VQQPDRFLAIGVAVLVAALVVVGALPVPRFIAADKPAVPQPAPDLSEVLVVEEQTTEHVGGEVDYDQTPPTGGDHNPAWLECGVYDAPVREENAVHSLEHGTIWVTHQPDLDEASIEALAAAVPAESIVSPYDGLATRIVVTAWGRQLAFDRADDPRLALFLAEYGDGNTAPEPLASCAGGVTAADSQGAEV